MAHRNEFKVLAVIPKHDGTGDWMMKVGRGYENKDGSINLYLDAIPVGVSKLVLNIRPLDEQDLQRRAAARANAAPITPRTPPPAVAGPLL